LVEPKDDVQRTTTAPVPDAVIEVDPRGRIEVVDARAEQLVGWPARDLLGCPIDVLVADRVGDPGPRAAGVDLLLSVRRREGAPFPAEIRLSTGGDAHDGHRVAVAIRDCSPGPEHEEHGPESLQVEQQPSRATDVAGLSTIAHDLNNVISVMLIYSELIERAVHGRSMDEYLGEIRAAADHGAELTGQLRSLARQSAPEPAAESARPRRDEDRLMRAIRRHAKRKETLDPVRVVVVDDHRMFAEGLARLLGFEDDIEVLGFGATGREAVALVERLRPRVLLLDFDMPDGNGILAAEEVKGRWPDTMIVMISGSTDDGLILRAIDAGCSGYLTKDRAASEVASAVRTVAAGEALISPAQMARLLPQLPRSHRGVGSDLTAHERKVLALMARGATNTSIAAQLSTSIDVARDDVARILAKLGAHSTLEAVATAIREGVIEYNSPF
jgi:DNA-binding NarL/FixJ family response regulator